MLGSERAAGRRGGFRLPPGARAASVALAAGLALVVTGQAQGATVSMAAIDDTDRTSWCGEFHEVRYESRVGERNDVQFSFVDGVEAFYPAPGPICTQVTPDVSLITDLTAPLLAQGPNCQNATPRAAVCSVTLIERLTISTGDQRDLVKVLPGNPPADISVGIGNDAVNVANLQRDVIHCGPGLDGVTVDGSDQVDPDCEKVTHLLP